ncbi:hypothetical protein MBLNU459_g3854t1 [Dothideomycetes sp. NU459]
MSASPAGPPSGPASTTPNGGPASTTPNGGPAPPVRRRKPQGPFAQKSKPPARRPPGQAPPPRAANSMRPGPSTASKPAAAPAPVPDPDDDPSLYTEFPLVTTKKSLLEGLRYHALRLVSADNIDPYDQTQFMRPLRLHRRFPRDTPHNTQPVVPDPEDDKEREKESIRKMEKQAEKEANQAQIAPTDKTVAAKKRQPFKKKTEDVYFPTDTPEAQKRAKLRYEEGRPWHLEDFENKNTWVGTYEEPLSETHAMFLLDENGNFRMVPLEKWYRFMPTARYKTMTLDEAEGHMNKKMKNSRWFLENADKGADNRRAELERQQRLQRGRVGMRGENRAMKGEDDDDVNMDFAHDQDEIDFELNDEFQDDDEDKLFGGDEEEVKDAERRIKQERHDANIFAGTGVKEDKDWYEEEERERKEAAEERKKAKKLRKNLIKRERKFEYESESDHPYSDESDSEDSEEERQREEEEKKKKEEEIKANGEKDVSGASSKGTNTPSGRPEKHSDPLRNKLSSAASLKRPGSPNLSEASGSESTHKRIKKQHSSSSQPSRTMSPAIPDGARALSPNSAIPRRPLSQNAGSGSDTEASGTERRSKNKNKTVPPRSMPGSPGYGTPANGTPVGSRAGSPVPSVPMPTADELRAAIPVEGITVKDLIRNFRSQIPKTKDGNAKFMALVKSVARSMGNPGGPAMIVPK